MRKNLSLSRISKRLYVEDLQLVNHYVAMSIVRSICGLIGATIVGTTTATTLAATGVSTTSTTAITCARASASKATRGSRARAAWTSSPSLF
jgi:hypothetical protein